MIHRSQTFGAHTGRVKSGDAVEPYIINRMLDRLDRLEGFRMGSQSRYTEPAYVLVTPEDGIPARSGVTLGKAECTLCRLVPVDGTDDVEIAGTGVTRLVYNIASGDVGGGIYFMPVVVNGVLVAFWEDCV